MLEVSLLNDLYGLDYTQRLHGVLAVCGLCGLYLHSVVRKLTPSYTSMVAAVPLFLVNMILPLAFSNSGHEVLSRAAICICLPFLGNIKVFGLCCNRGPLAGHSWSTIETILLYMLPIVPTQECVLGGKRGRLADNAGGPSKVFASFLANTALLTVVAYLLAYVPVPRLVKHYLYGLGLYGFLTVAMDSTSVLLTVLLDLHIVPAFDKPWLCASLAEFWGRRWNNTISLSLRTVVYDPIMEGHLFNQPISALVKTRTTDTTSGSTVKNGATGSTMPTGQHHVPLLTKAVATAAIFAVSGCMHEYVLWLITREGEYRPGYWFAFFFVQFPLMICEGLLLKQLKSMNIFIPRIVRICSTMAVLLFTGYMFWFPPVESLSPVANRCVDAVNRNALDGLAVVQGLSEQLGSGYHWLHASSQGISAA